MISLIALALLFGVGLYFGWFIWPSPPGWAVSLNSMVRRWIDK